ncbi:hypothetical protein ACFQDF_19010 [Ectobacillus funiculus]|uniref:Uncharacterized protein n=2 Tax=Ectobacillus funiculus TaxID=137993 RepID=A0ABV5WA37_9BACI
MFGYFNTTNDEEPIQAQANIGHSGNSDVDVFTHIEVDTKPIAYAMLCSLYAQGKLSKNEFNLAVRKLEVLMNRNKQQSN